jgi:hypothetical protein
MDAYSKDPRFKLAVTLQFVAYHNGGFFLKYQPYFSELKFCSFGAGPFKSFLDIIIVSNWIIC